MIIIILLSLVIPGINSGNTKYNQLINLLKTENNQLKEYVNVREELIRVKEAVSIAKEERLSLLKRKDKTVVRINGFKRILNRRNKKLKKLIRALYKLTNSYHGQSFILNGAVSVPLDGRHALILIIKRELQEISNIKSDFNELTERLKNFKKTIKRYESLIIKLNLKKTDTITTLARVKFALNSTIAKRMKIPKTLYDAKAWKIWSKISPLRKNLFTKPISFRNSRGILMRPVPGVFLKDHTKSKGVYISAKPGMRVKSPEAGVVRFIGKVAGYGLVVVIEHSESYYSLIGLMEKVIVKNGENVIKGSVVGNAGTLGNTPYVPIYFELRKGTKYLNPRLWLR